MSVAQFIAIVMCAGFVTGAALAGLHVLRGPKPARPVACPPPADHAEPDQGLRSDPARATYVPYLLTDRGWVIPAPQVVGARGKPEDQFVWRDPWAAR